jgi:hypothetical protein
MIGVGWWNGFLHGFDGNVVSWFAENMTPRIFSALCNKASIAILLIVILME